MAAVSNVNQSPITTLKVSVTGECNLQCFYCKPIGRVHELIPNQNSFVAASDYSKIMKIAAEAGIERVLIGGGEPLLRKDISQVTKAIVGTKKLQEVRFITNGTFLKNYADALKRVGLKHLEINLDSLNFMIYQKVTRRDSLHRVLDGLEKVERLDFESLILNIILMRGVNERELVDFAVMSKTRPIHLRFIEYVTQTTETITQQLHFPILNIKRAIENFQSLIPSQEGDQEVFRFADGTGKMSFHTYQNGYLSYSGPRLVLNSHGMLYVDTPQGRSHNIAKELEKEGWDERIYRAFTKLMVPAESSDIKADRKTDKRAEKKESEKTAARSGKRLSVGLAKKSHGGRASSRSRSASL